MIADTCSKIGNGNFILTVGPSRLKFITTPEFFFGAFGTPIDDAMNLQSWS